VNNYHINVRPFGSHAILIEWPNLVEEAILEDILRYISVLKSKVGIDAWEIVPAYNSLTLISHGKDINFKLFSAQLYEWYQEKIAKTESERFLWRLPVCYDLDFGIDMLEVAGLLHVDISKIIELHTSHKYTVYGIGFLPGFMYLGGVPQALEVPRRATPRLKVVKGSVGLAARQTGIYPQESPGGWNIIGNCPVPMFDANSATPCFVSVGDQVQFYAVERAAYELIQIEAEVGIYNLEKSPIYA